MLLTTRVCYYRDSGQDLAYTKWARRTPCGLMPLARTAPAGLPLALWQGPRLAPIGAQRVGGGAQIVPRNFAADVVRHMHVDVVAQELHPAWHTSAAAHQALTHDWCHGTSAGPIGIAQHSHRSSQFPPGCQLTRATNQLAHNSPSYINPAQSHYRAVTSQHDSASRAYPRCCCFYTSR